MDLRLEWALIKPKIIHQEVRSLVHPRSNILNSTDRVNLYVGIYIHNTDFKLRLIHDIDLRNDSQSQYERDAWCATFSYATLNYKIW